MHKNHQNDFNESGDSIMPVIERIVRVQNSDKDAYIRMQEKRIKQLQEVYARKASGKVVKTKKILVYLTETGILDSDGKLSCNYSEDK